jgi:hypothetical protein
MYFRPTAAAVELLRTWGDGLRSPVDQWENDQGVFNRILSQWRSRWRKVGAHTLHVHDRLTLALLPVSTFCSGHVFFAQHLPKRLVRELRCLGYPENIRCSLSLARSRSRSRSLFA